MRRQSICRQSPHHAVGRHVLYDNILAVAVPHGTSRQVAIESDIVCEMPTLHPPNISQRHARDGFIAQIHSGAYFYCLFESLQAFESPARAAAESAGLGLDKVRLTEFFAPIRLSRHQFLAALRESDGGDG